MSTYDILLFISVKLIFVNFHRLHAITYIYIYIYTHVIINIVPEIMWSLIPIS